MRIFRFLPLVSAAAVCLSLMTAPTAVTLADDDEENIIVSDDFDDGTVGKWGTFGGGNLSIDSSTAQSGGYSIKITGREKNYQGPSIQCDSLFIPGETYNFDGWVYHECSNAITISWTLKYTDSTGEDAFMQIKSDDVPPNEWFNLNNDIQIPPDTNGFRIYFESTEASADFNIDTVTIKGKQASTAKEDEKSYEDSYNFDFEEDIQGWTPRGSLRVVHTDETSQSGKYSIFVSNRSSVWNGPTVCINDMVKKGEKYYYSAYVMYDGEENEDAHTFRLEVQYTLNGSDHYDTVATKELKKGKWTKLSGFHTVPKGAENLYVYVQTDNLPEGAEPDGDDLMAFYVDNVTITKGSVVIKETRKKFILLMLIISASFLALVFIIDRIARKVNKNTETIEKASIDSMTKLLNRNAYEKRLKEFENDPKSCSGLYFALCDVNFMKYINDNFGHEKGDEAITRCAQMLKKIIGKSGNVYRTGGDEFICVSKTPIKDAVKAAAKAEYEKDTGYPFAVACGFAEYDSKKLPDIKSIIDKCDQEMYKDKQRIKSKHSDFSRK